MPRRRTHVLAADVGGTKTALALAAVEGRWPGIVAQQTYPSQDYESLEAIIADFLCSAAAKQHARVLAAACVCVAGPVEHNRARTTNLRWVLDAKKLARHFDVPAVRLINDFAAAALGVARLSPRQLKALQKGRRVAAAARAVIGAGTGLGVALVTYDGQQHEVHASEGGHADFAPVNELQDGLLDYLRRKHGRVSYERVLSGAGLANIYEYLSRKERPSAALTEALADERDDAAVVSRFGLEGRDPVATNALNLFAEVYGAFAGNVALTVLARGGVYIAGGIAPKIASKLADGSFVRGFVSKGRFSEMLKGFPVDLVMNPQVGLYGALDLARRLAREPAARA